MKFIPSNEDGWIEGRGYRKKILLLPDDLNSSGTLVQLVEIPPATDVPLHHHRKSTEVFHILEGSGYMNIAGCEHHLNPGDTLGRRPQP